MQKLISISLSPNVFPEDIGAAREMLVLKEEWQEGEYIKKFENAFARYLQLNPAEWGVYTLNAGRSALLFILEALSIGEGDEVLLQAFTCNAVPNPVIWVGARPVYVDIKEDTFNIDVNDLEKKITPRAKAIIVQHTFGLAADMEKILPLAKKYNLLVLEDCAHALGATHKGKKLGTFGDAAFFSFGRDKVISSVYGGLALLNLKSKILNLKFHADKIYNELSYPSQRWIQQQLRHPLMMERFLRWYNAPFNNYGVGKFLLRASQLTAFLSKAVHWKEKIGRKPKYFPCRFPNALAYLALKQFERLEQFNMHRRRLAEFYYASLIQDTRYKIQDIIDGHIYLRYPVRHRKAHQIISQARKKAILLGDWYDSVVAPQDTRLDRMLYKKGSCPVAEKLAHETFNLPTNPALSLLEAREIVYFLKKYAG